MNPRVFYSFDYSCQQPHRNHNIITWTAETERERLLHLLENDPLFCSLSEEDRDEATLFLQNALTFSAVTDATCHIEIYDSAKLILVKISHESLTLHERSIAPLQAMNQIAPAHITAENESVSLAFFLIYLHTQFIL